MGKAEQDVKTYTEQDIMETYADGWRDGLANLGLDAEGVDAPDPLILVDQNDVTWNDGEPPF